ncbi:DUF7309 domain-containing protein [Limnochorda pilosa]|uniref:GNAT family N-acetyltransferase n=1 Tax=Limnochorda pilosa TaxID=1555112 RepID=A0A0K2SIS1_LIMPI|nr:hypothetical protein [Limnochorda pilosa]BAS26719.1 hypothetical protein LIP_0862 [Limnochorda pilosa]
MAKTSSKGKLDPDLWRLLLDAALEFAELAPWRWLWDAPAFGVQDPVSGEVFFCSVLGRNGEVFGLLAFPGAEGFWTYMQMGRAEPLSSIEFEARIACGRYLSFDLGSRDEVSPEERALYRDLGFSFRGKQAWPVFRSAEPGYFPTRLNEQQVRLFTTLLRQATFLAQETREQPAAQDRWMMEREDPGSGAATYRVMTLIPPGRARVPSAGSQHGPKGVSSQDPRGEDDGRWTRGWAQVSPRAPLPLHFPVDQARAQKLRKYLRQAATAWEMDLWPLPIQLGERGTPPRHAFAALCVDRDNGLALNAEVSAATEVFNMTDFLFTTVERTRAIPGRIMVHRRDVAAALAPAAEALGTKAVATRSLRVLSKFYESLEDRLGGP